MGKVNQLIQGPYEVVEAAPDQMVKFWIYDTRKGDSEAVVGVFANEDAQRVCDALNLYTNFMSNAENVLDFTMPPRQLPPKVSGAYQCTCGDPERPGWQHRTYSPCYPAA